MRSILHSLLPLRLWGAPALLAVLLCIGCKEKPEDDEPEFVVNQATENSSISVLPEGGEAQLFVVCEKEWTYQFKAPADWLSVSDKKVNGTSWMLTLSAGENSGPSARSAVLVFSSASLVREVTVQQEPEDPILQVTALGAYGVEGGDVIYERGRAQISRLTDGDSFQFSFLYPSEVKVVSVTVPSSLEEGAVVSLGYRVVEKDRTLFKSEYPAATVLRIREPYVWLKVSDTVYFVIKK